MYACIICQVFVDHVLNVKWSHWYQPITSLLWVFFYYLEDSEALKFNSLQLSLCQESTFWLYQRAGLLDKQIKCYGSSIVWFWGTQIRSSIRSFSIIMVPPCPTTTRLFSSRHALIYKQNDFQFYRKSFIMVWQKIINTLCNKICCYCAWICS